MQVLSHKYINNGSLWHSSSNAKASITWRSIVKARDALREGFDMRLGSGSSPLWYSDWLQCGPLCYLLDYVHISDTNVKISDIWKNGSWDLSGLATIIPPHIHDVIMQQNVPTHVDDSLTDSWVWKGNKDGIYNVATGYSWLSHNKDLSVNSHEWD